MWNIRALVRRFGMFFVVGVFTFVVGQLLLMLFIGHWGMSAWLADIFKLVIVIEGNFVLNNYLTWPGKKPHMKKRVVNFHVVKVFIGLVSWVLFLSLLPNATAIAGWGMHFTKWLTSIDVSFTLTLLTGYQWADAFTTALIMPLSFILNDKFVFFVKNGITLLPIFFRTKR